MDIDIILEPDVTPAQVAEIGVEAERLGIRALWSSNYHSQYDAFLSLAPVAAATSKLIIGPLAVSPWEMHPLKMATAILTLNEMADGRAMIAVSAGGGPLGAIGWKASNDGPVCHPKTRSCGSVSQTAAFAGCANASNSCCTPEQVSFRWAMKAASSSYVGRTS